MTKHGRALCRVRSAVVMASVALVAGMSSIVFLASPASASNVTFAGTVTDSVTAVPIGGAIVVLEGNGSAPQTALSASDGTFAINIAAGTYSLVAQGPGYQVLSQSGVVITGGGVTGYAVPLVASGSTLQKLPVDGGHTGAVLPGGSGVFYVSSGAIPQIFRTVDYGGSWSPVTVAYDDSTHGLPSHVGLDPNAIHLAASGYPGEVAVLLGGPSTGNNNTFYLYVSRDYGVSWIQASGSITTANGAGGQIAMGWGDSGGTDVILINSPSANYIVDMTKATPALQQMTSPYMSPGSVFAVANGSSGPFVAVASDTAATVSVYSLSTALSAPSAVATVPYPTGFPGSDGSSQQLYFGGTSSGTAPPSIFVVTSSATNGPTFAGVKDIGATSYTAVGPDNATVSGPAPCWPTPGNYGGSIDPTADATGPTGLDALVGNCYMTATLTPSPSLTFSSDTNSGAIGGNPGNGNAAFDTGFNGAGGSDQVVMANGQGAIKAAQFDSSTGPEFDTSNVASAGVATGSGGVSINGITVPEVPAIALGPDQTHDVSSMAGNFGVASTDGGATFTPALDAGGFVTAWWQGFSSSWLVYGGVPAPRALTVRADWNSSESPLVIPNVDLSGTPLDNQNITALAPVPGQDTLFIGTTPSDTSGVVDRLSLSGAGDAITAAPVSGATNTSTTPVESLQYCPAGSNASVADSLFVGTSASVQGGGPSGTIGGLVKISNASTTLNFTGTATGIPTDNGPVVAVAVDCASGTVWAGTGAFNAADGGLYKSTDGGTTFNVVSAFGPNPPHNLLTPEITAIAINPLNTSQVLVAANSEGELSVTNDGGATWSIVNDPLGAASPPVAGSRFGELRALAINGAAPGRLVPFAGPASRTTQGRFVGAPFEPQPASTRPASIVGSGAGMLTGRLPARSSTALQLSATKVTYGGEQVERLSVVVSSQLTNPVPSGTVTVKESTAALCVITLSAAKGSCTLPATKLGAGTYGLVATYAGSANFAASTSANATLTVAKATSATALKLSPANVTYGDEEVKNLLSVSVSPQYAGSTPTGTVTIKESSTTLCVIALSAAKGACTLPSTKLPVAAYSVVASYGGSTDFSISASPKATLTVAKATSKTALKLLTAKVTYGKEGVKSLISVTVAPEFSGSTPTGTVTVKESTTTLCVITLSATKVSCTLSNTKLPVGNYSLVATYGGSTDFAGSASAKETLTVVK